MLSWIVAGVTYSLDDETITRLLGHDGLGMSPLHRLSERGPLQNGDTDRGFRLDPRVVLLTLGIHGSDMDDLYAKRSTLTDIFKPRTVAGKLRFERGTTVRDLDCHLIEGDGLRFSDNDRQYLWQRCVVALKASDPTWYDPAGASSLFNLGAGSDTLEVPMTIPMTVGVSTLDTSKTIVYPGTAKVFPRIRITGPVTNCIITHQQMDWKLDFTGTTIGSGEYFDIDLRYGRKTVIDQAGANQISTLTNDSDLAEYSLLPDPDVGGGNNTIGVTGASIDPSTEISLTYFVRYIGL